jgi:uncharacterized protein YjbJ (UPF0337 family)
MISQICKSLLTIGLASFFFFTLVFGFAVEKSWAANSFTQMLDFPHTPIATMERVKMASKELEGKTQEAIGNVMGDAKNQIIGKAKQAETMVRNTAENIKDNVKLPERVKAASKELEGKTQEAIGNVMGDRKAQIAGKAKQVESKTRNLMEDAKDKVKGMLK